MKHGRASDPQSSLDPARRRFYAALVARGGPVPAPDVEAAFAVVPREHFLGPGPWWTGLNADPADDLQTPDDDPVWLCQNMTFALDRTQRINNGMPSLHALCLARLALADGSVVAHVGAGSGYYSAILAELAGATGHVDAFEIDTALARQATANLSGRWLQARVHASDGGVDGALPPASYDVIYANASATTPVPAWLRALRPGGRLMFPLTPTGEAGAMLMVTKDTGDGYAAKAVMGVHFIPARGLQNPEDSTALTAAFKRGWPRAVRSLRVGTAPEPDSCWVAGAGWWLSTAPPPT